MLTLMSALLASHVVLALSKQQYETGFDKGKTKESKSRKVDDSNKV